jgi:hypothetical protein
MKVEFLREIGLEPAERVRASRNPLESPLALSDSVGWVAGGGGLCAAHS